MAGLKYYLKSLLKPLIYRRIMIQPERLMLSRQPFVETADVHGDVVEVGYHLGSTAAVINAIGYAWKRMVTDPRRLRDWQSRTIPLSNDALGSDIPILSRPVD
jgi:hypothetical protein